MKEIGMFLRSKRKERGWSYRQMAIATGLSHSYLESLEKNFDRRSKKEIKPTIDTLTKLSRGMGMTVNEFLFQAGVNKNPDYREGGKELDLNWVYILPEEIRQFISDTSARPWVELANDLHKAGFRPETIRNLIALFTQEIHRISDSKLDDALRNLSKLGK